MGMLKLDAVVHWSIPVNNLEDSEKFYGEILGLETCRPSCYLAHVLLYPRRP